MKEKNSFLKEKLFLVAVLRAYCFFVSQKKTNLQSFTEYLRQFRALAEKFNFRVSGDLYQY